MPSVLRPKREPSSRRTVTRCLMMAIANQRNRIMNKHATATLLLVLIGAIPALAATKTLRSQDIRGAWCAAADGIGYSAADDYYYDCSATAIIGPDLDDRYTFGSRKV